MKSNYKRLGDYIRQIDVRNKDEKVTRLLGVSIDKKFIESIANTIGTDMSVYKIVRRGQFAYGPVTSRNGDKVSIALLTEEECIISSSYTVFEIIDTKALLPEYLNLWFKRSEFDRYARFHSNGSAREIFDWEEMCNKKRLNIRIAGENLLHEGNLYNQHQYEHTFLTAEYDFHPRTLSIGLTYYLNNFKDLFQPNKTGEEMIERAY